MGQIQTFTTEDGNSFRAYIPDNVSDDTAILHYSYLLGYPIESDTIWQGYEEALIAQNPDSIVIIPENPTLVVGNDNPASHIYQNEVLDSIETLEAELGINVDKFYAGGWSAGFGFSVRTMAHYLEANPDSARPVMFCIDGFMNDSTCIQKSELETLAEHNAIITSYTQPQNFNLQAQRLQSTGLPILYIVDPTIPEYSTKETGYWSYHNYMTENFYDSGLYEDLIKFTNGEGELPEGFTYKVYDPATGEIRDIAREDIADFFGIEPYMKPFTFENLSTLVDYTIESSSEVMTNHLSTIKNNISSSSVLSSSFDSMSFNSTTKIPAKIPFTISHYMRVSSELLAKLANELFQFAKVTKSIEETNQQLEEEAENLNDAINNSTSSQQNNNEETQNFYNNMSPNNPQNNDDNSQNNNISNNNSSQTLNSGNNSNSNNNYSGSNYVPNTPSTKEENPLEEFPRYNELFSDDNKVVYEYIDKSGNYCKIVIHKENDKILGIEHYYDFKTAEKAKSSLSEIETTYSNSGYFDNIKAEGQYIKVILSEKMYKDMTVQEVQEKYYSNLKEVKE